MGDLRHLGREVNTTQNSVCLPLALSLLPPASPPSLFRPYIPWFLSICACVLFVLERLVTFPLSGTSLGRRRGLGRLEGRVGRCREEGGRLPQWGHNIVPRAVGALKSIPHTPTTYSITTSSIMLSSGRQGSIEKQAKHDLALNSARSLWILLLLVRNGEWTKLNKRRDTETGCILAYLAQ